MLEPIIGEIVLETGAERAWSVITEPRHVVRWLGCMSYSGEPGSLFYMQQDPDKRAAGDISGATHCRILKLDRPKLFRFSWFLPGTPETEVDFALTVLAPSRTRVTLTHRGWDKFDAREIRAVWEALSGGWTSFVLPSLKREAEA
jgi:uncharacterized protein YndB with AHSA1/START domain